MATPCKFPDINTTSADSIATSVPVPIASPTSASAKAGASLIPSPTKAILPYFAFSSLTALTLPSGRTSAITSSIPNCLAIARAVRALSPVTIATLRPNWCRALIAAGVVVLIGSATAIIPASSPSTAT